MGGRSRKSVLRQKLAKYYRERENPLALAFLQEELIRLNRERMELLNENLRLLQEKAQKPVSEEEEENVSRLVIRKFGSEPDRKFINRAFYEALYPITLEYQCIPLHAIFIWYLQALEMVYGEKLNQGHFNRLQKWVRRWLMNMTEEDNMKLKSEIITWILNKFA
ncbi:MAG: hypothetical protein GXO17_03450 [Thermodesulfobacteria bacterium]|nr:hypothetical protein [Thermodesulfobacteriota bacterium]